MQDVLVIGGSGFIGQHLVRALADRGHATFATHTPGRSVPHLAGVHWIPCDLASASATVSWPACHTVIFLAQGRHWRSFPQGADAVFATNVAGLFRAVEHALKVNAQRFLYASTGSVYTEPGAINVAGARSFYVATKLAAEVLLGPYATQLPVGVLRLFMPYGPGQSPDMLLPQLIAKVRGGTSIQLHGRDGLRANPVAVADVTEVLLHCLKLAESATLDVAGPEILTLRQIGDTIGKVVGRQPIFEVLQDKAPPSLIGETSALKGRVGWLPDTLLEAGLRHWLHTSPCALAG